MKDRFTLAVWLLTTIGISIGEYADHPHRGLTVTILLALLVATTIVSSGAAGRKEKWGVCTFILALPATVAFYVFNEELGRAGFWIFLTTVLFTIEHDRVKQMRKAEQESERLLREDRESIEEQYERLMRLAK